MPTALKVLVFTVAVVIGVASSPASAQEAGFANEGFFIGVTASGNATITGPSFDGQHLFRDSEEVLLVPRLHEERAFGVVLGGRFTHGAIEFAYARSRHPGTFMGAEGTVVFHAVDINGRGFLLTSKRFQPWWVVGLSIPMLIAKEGSANREGVDDARFGGVGVNVGGGLATYLHPRVALLAGYTYRWLSFSDARGAADKWKELDDAMRGHNAGFTTAMTFTF